eukprot:PhM_4_TR3203/c0_g1_i1/m.100747/K20300/TRAPPC1, BET5; trafficking protein particle complex subunit 1
MTVYSFHIFDRTGVTIFKTEPTRRDTPYLEEHDEQYANLLQSLADIASAFTGSASGAAVAAQGGPNQPSPLVGFRTNKYRVHILKTLTGVTFALCTHAGMPDARPRLQEFYSTVFVEHVCRDASYPIGEGAATITSPAFAEACGNFLKG